MSRQAADTRVMSIVDHLADLRRALVVSLLAVAAGFACCLFYTPRLVGWLTMPLAHAGLYYYAPAGGVGFMLRVAFAAGVVVASPVVAGALGWFVAPGLTPAEKRVAPAVAVIAALLFVAGAAFGYRAILPAGLAFLLGCGGPHMVPRLSADAYFSFAFTCVTAAGAIFEFPLVLLALLRAGLLSRSFLVRQRRYVFLATTVVAAALTPSTDLVTQLLLALPMYLMYEGVLAITWLWDRRRSARGANS